MLAGSWQTMRSKPAFRIRALVSATRRWNSAGGKSFSNISMVPFLFRP